jgi:raffinose/stachyose/melibiose transport system permease protein
MNTQTRKQNSFIFVFLCILAVAYMLPIFIVFMNSFKGRFFISDAPFELPNEQTFVRLDNYTSGIAKTGFIQAFGYSLFITVFSVLVIVVCTSMTAWAIARVKSRLSAIFYYLLVFSMIVPFQMVMFTMSKMANILHLDNPIGIIFIYLGYGAGLSVFIFSGFIRNIPIEVEEAAIIDGATPLQTFFLVVFPMLKPVGITVTILNTMWVWNDYLLPYLVIGSNYKTIPIAIQYLQGGYGSRDMGAMMAMLVLAILPIVIFYMTSQENIIEGVATGAVKG